MTAKKAKPDIIELLEKSGIPFKIVTIKMDPKIEKAVRDYVMKIEEAHKRAANSKLHFGVNSPIKQTGLLLFLRHTRYKNRHFGRFFINVSQRILLDFSLIILLPR